MMWIIPLLAMLVSIAFAWKLSTQAAQRKKWSDMLFAASLWMFVVATYGEFYGSAFGWNPWMYKVYYFAAIALVAYMAAATLYARTEHLLSKVFVAYTLAVSLTFLITLIVAPVQPDIFEQKGPIGGEYMPSSVRLYSPLLSAVGGVILLISAALSWWQTRRFGFATIFIAAMILSSGGVVSKYVAWPGILPTTEFLGIIAYYIGVQQLAHDSINISRENRGGGERGAQSHS